MAIKINGENNGNINKWTLCHGENKIASIFVRVHRHWNYYFKSSYDNRLEYKLLIFVRTLASVPQILLDSFSQCNFMETENVEYFERGDFLHL